MQKPLITFFVAAYNQKRFVREAVEAALAQTYSPLQVILSDDSSSDGTFEVMRKAATEYHGKHRVTLNQNPVRLSLGGHLNKIVSLSQGEIIVCAAGDDVSLPHRTEAIYDAWERSGRKATSIHSDYLQIDEAGNEIEKMFQRGGDAIPGEQDLYDPINFVQTLQPTVFGCTHAFSKELFRSFGDVPAALIHEDDVLALRSILGGRITYIDQALVKYRVHKDNVYASKDGPSHTLEGLAREEGRLRAFYYNRQTMYRVFLEDLKIATQQGLLESQQYVKIRGEVLRLLRRCSLVIGFLNSGFVRKCSKLAELRAERLSRDEYRMLMRRLLPRPLLLRARWARNYAQRTFSFYDSAARRGPSTNTA